MMPKSVINLSVLAVLVCLFVQSTFAGSLKWRDSDGIGDPESDQALEAVATRLTKLTNLTADPCDDFYEFACGGARQQVEDESISKKLKDLVGSRLNYLLASPSVNATRGLQLMKNLSNSFEIRHKSKSNGETIRQLVRKLGGIPALGEGSGWIEGTQTSWPDLAVQLRRLGLQTDLLYNLRVDQNYANKSLSAIYLSLPHLPVDAIDNSRLSYMWIVKEYLMPDITEAESGKFMEDLELTVDFRIQLSEILKQYNNPKLNNKRKSSQSPRVGFQRYDYLELVDFQQMSIKSLELLVPKLDWTGFLSELFQYPVSSETDIFVYKPESFVMVQKLIQSQTNPDVLRNFMMLEAINDLAMMYINNQDGTGSIKGELGLALSAEYVRNYLLPETRASATIMVDYFRRELKTMIGEADWISDMAKRGALAKADSMISYVGYPDELLDENVMAELYSGLELEQENFIANMLNLNRWNAQTESRVLKQPFKESSWHVFKWATDINSYYHPLFNSINILPTMMQDFLYNSNQPNYVNFAALGFIVGHEISHAFDSNNIKYDCHGDDHCWWDAKTGAEYQQRSKCFEQQYNGSQAFGDYSRLNGSLTLGENIADNIGAKIAHRAYQSWLADQPAGYEEPLLAGSLAKFNQDQLFWTSMAQFWCSKEESFDEIDVHSPRRLRVDITLSNQAEFAETFECRIGSRMNPASKCAMW